MKIAVCCKFTPDTEDVVAQPDGAVDATRANWSVSEYDLQAIQAAADVCAEGDETYAVTAGTPDIDQTRLTKALLSRGNLSSLYRVMDESLEGADAAAVARVLAAALRATQADVVLFGEGSSDRYARVTGSLVAAELGWPCVNAVCAIERSGDAFTVERDVEDGVEVVEVTAPCVIVTNSTINIPPIPKMKALLAAGKKPVETVSVADLGVDVDASLDATGRGVPAEPGRKKMVLEGAPDDIAAQLVDLLRADQVL